jgi:LacI family transcriptional regulator
MPRLAVFVINMEYTKPEDFGYDLVMGFRQAAEPSGYQVEMIPLTLQLQQDIHYDTYMVQNNYSGALMLGLSLLDPWMKDFETCKTPTILYDNHISTNPRVTHVGVDNAEGMELAVQYLKSLGHTKIGYLSSALEAYVYNQRYQAFFQALKNNGLEADENLAGCSYFINNCLSQYLPGILEAGCTAIVCSHDLLAHSAMIHCAQMGYRIPEDISIMGFDVIPMCRYTLPPLTTVRQDRINIGKSGFYAMLNQLNNVHVTSLLLHPELIERDSCATVTEK